MHAYTQGVMFSGLPTNVPLYFVADLSAVSLYAVELIYVYLYVRVCMRGMYVCVHVCMRACMHVHPCTS